MIRGLKKSSLILLVLLTFSSSGCRPPDPKIFYPGTGSFGENLLRTNPPSISTSNCYSLSAEVRGNTMVRIAIPNSSLWDFSFDPPPIGWTIISNSNWTVFSAKGEGSYDCEIYFKQPLNSNSFLIKIYEENSNTPKIITFN
ncbi:MAG: hypothetical protein GY754_23255 [bacterium]|nr:hypothetical protein [bacterium]